MRRLTALFVMLMPGMALSAPVCDLSGAALVDAINGQWELRVTAAKVLSDGSEQIVTPGPPETVTLTLNDVGTGVMMIKTAKLPMQTRPLGGAGIRAMPDHSAPFKAALESLAPEAKSAMTECDIGSLPHLNAELKQGDPDTTAHNVVEMILVNDGVLAGAQVAQVPGQMLGQANAPDIIIVSSIILRRISGGATQ